MVLKLIFPRILTREGKIKLNSKKLGSRLIYHSLCYLSIPEDSSSVLSFFHKYFVYPYFFFFSEKDLFFLVAQLLYNLGMYVISYAYPQKIDLLTIPALNFLKNKIFC